VRSIPAAEHIQLNHQGIKKRSNSEHSKPANFCYRWWIITCATRETLLGASSSIRDFKDKTYSANKPIQLVILDIDSNVYLHSKYLENIAFTDQLPLK